MVHAVEGILASMPEVKISIADDGRPTDEKNRYYRELEKMGHTVLPMRFDSGFGAKSNKIAENLKTPYLLIGSDDFEFRPPEVRAGIERLTTVLDWVSEIDIACGRVDNSPYERTFDIDEGTMTVIEHPIGNHYNSEGIMGGTVAVSAFWQYVDLAKNYCLIRKRIFDNVKWDDDVCIGGGEHASFFLDVKNAGGKCVFVNDVNINAQSGPDSMEYNRYRRRANSKDRPCFKKRGIKKYILANGKIDYQEAS